MEHPPPFGQRRARAEQCPQCGGTLTILAAIEHPPVIAKILTHLGLPARAPPRQNRRICASTECSGASRVARACTRGGFPVGHTRPRLLTRDAARYRSYFPTVDLIAPA